MVPLAVFFLFVFVALTFLLPLLVEHLLVNLIHLSFNALCVRGVWTIIIFCTRGLPPGVALAKNKTNPPRYINFPPAGLVSEIKTIPSPGGKLRSVRYTADP
ncbi:unnamed protein product [Ectocarpus sp. 8 AP-2014]